MKGCIIPYLTFHGEAREAAAFYADLFGLTNLGIQCYGDADFPSPPEAADLVIHCHLQKGDFQLMLADSTEERTQDMQHGLSLTVLCEDEEEIQRLYDGLLAEGTMLMELQETFWGAKYAKVRDKYGFIWDLSAERE
ncbi:VOC family protein [Sporosarcina sp. FSL W7-1349]|uniref:VOC family protein n=1 Tax=Sporosarcina sp. FSL W7-1349 TaxID=2921561 RepID=UPI0030F6E149